MWRPPVFTLPEGVWRCLCPRVAENPMARVRRHVSMAGYVGAYRGDA